MRRKLLRIKLSMCRSEGLSFLIETDHGHISQSYGTIRIFDRGSVPTDSLPYSFSLSNDLLEFMDYKIDTEDWQAEYGKRSLEVLVNALNIILNILREHGEEDRKTPYKLVSTEERYFEAGSEIWFKFERTTRFLGTQVKYLRFEEAKAPRFEDKALYDFVCDRYIKDNMWSFGAKEGTKYIVVVSDDVTFQNKVNAALDRIHNFYL